MTRFKTLVIFDLETTGLPHLELRMTKITEMTLIAFLISHLENEDIPRVMNKLTLALNPMKMILPETSKITGLDNELLEEMKAFDDNVVFMMNRFLERLPQPLCLIAHNGNKFDFPILMRQLVKCRTKLIDNVYCADSLLAFREILPKLQDSNNCKVLSQPIQPKSIDITEFDETESKKIRISAETTPETKPVPFNDRPMKSSGQYMRMKRSNVARKLVFDVDIEIIDSEKNHDNSDINQSQREENCNYGTTNKKQINQRILKSYKLGEIYSYLHGEVDINFHRSEEDCMALLSCINKCKDDFLNWLCSNAILLSQIEPLF